ncbi:MAG: helix-turn-helix domain-containing protein [Planctomycetes bacterium]|nr:helix-turn-helix domain-containing protein [Planctomycetota bacterium]
MRDTDNKRLVDGGILARVLATSPNQVRRLEKEGAIPSYRVGSQVRFDVQEVLDALRAKGKRAEVRSA